MDNFQTPCPPRSIKHQTASAIDKCCCNNSKCSDIIAKLRNISGLEHLANLLNVARSNNTSQPSQRVSALYRAVMMALGIRDEVEGNSIKVARWHWRDECFKVEDGRERLFTTCRDNPDSDGSIKYRLDAFKVKQGATVARSQPNDEFISAPTVNLVEIEERIVHFDKMNNNAGRLSDICGKEKARLEAWQTTSPLVVGDFKEQLKGEQRKNQEIQEELSKALAEVKLLMEENKELKRQRLEELSPPRNEGALHISNLGDYAYWKKQPARVLKMFFQIDDVNVLWGYVRTALTMFDSPEALKLTHGGVDKKRQLALFPPQFRKRAKELAVELTPSGKRQKIQSSAKRTLSDVQSIVLTLISRRQGLGQSVLSSLLSGINISQSTVSRVMQLWLPRVGLLGRCLAFNPLSEQEALFLMPSKFVNAGYGRTYAIVDCRDVLTDRVRIDSSVSRMQYSDKVSSAAARCFVMCHPCGLVIFLGEPAFARSSELTIFRALEPIFPDIPATMRVMGDRAYKFASSFLRNHNQFDVPDNKPGEGFQFTNTSVATSKDMSQLRYVVETVNSRSSSWRTADDVVPREDLPNFSNTYYISFSMSIFMKPLMQPKDCEFRSLIDALMAAFAQSGTRDLFLAPMQV
jgi:hypothetical protein